MRKIATLFEPVKDVRRVMLYAADGGTYLFLYTTLEDGPCEFDHFYPSTADAERAAEESFGVTARDWVLIADPLPGAQHDWIRPTRVKCDEAGNMLAGHFEAIPQAG